MAECPAPAAPRRRTLLLLAGCIVVPPLAAAPPAAMAIREIDLQAFDELELAVPADVEIVIGDRDHARVEAERKVVDSIAFRNRGNRLQVVVARSIQTTEPIRIRITCRRLVALAAHAATDASLAGLAADRFSLVAADSASIRLSHLNLSTFEADITGSASVDAAGKARSQVIRIAGAGSYDAGDLESAAVTVTASGSSDVVVDSRISLDAVVSGAATVQYRGNPTVNQSVAEAGTLERH
jgi:hypothetical protein